MLVDAGGRARLTARAGRSSISTPLDDVSFPLGIARRGDPLKAYVTIIEGCNEFCAFCVVPYTRGHERMRPVADILADARHAVGDRRAGECSCSGRSSTTTRRRTIPACDFAALLERLNDIDGLERIRFASPHPRHVTPRMIAAMRDLPKVCRHLHLPVQSGSTRVLAAMRRRHTREEYLELVARLREAMPDIALSTDMIVGFPGETAEDFEETLSLTARRPLSQHVLVQVLAAPEHARAQAHAGRRGGGGEDAADRRAAGAAAGHPGGAVPATRSGRVETCWSTRAAGAATGSCRAARAATRS